MTLSIYLAGPDVFLPDARRVGEQKRAMCQEAGFKGLFPLDNCVPAGAAGVFRANCSLLRQADIGIFNLTPFRGPSADPGTVFELGFLFASGKPLYGYSGISGAYCDRIAKLYGPLCEENGQLRDCEGHTVENFALGDNLMVVRAIEDSGGAVVAIAEDSLRPAEAPLAAFTAFKSCLRLIEERFGRPRG